MKHNNIAGTELDVSALCLGTGAVGTSLNAEQSYRLLDCFVHEGGSFIDTANVYGKWLEAGTASGEIMIGKWLKDRQCRERIIIGTKGAHPDLKTMDVSRLSPQDITEDLEESLLNLQTDYIDLYWLHRDDLAVPVADIIDTLSGHVQTGKIRYFGCSNWSVVRIKEAQQYCEMKGVKGFVANQLMWNLASVNKEHLGFPGLEVMDEVSKPFHIETQMTAIPYTSQANGLFTKALRQDFHSNEAYDGLKRLYVNDVTMRRVEKVRKLVQETGWEATQIALAYILNQPIPTIPIIGPRNESQLLDSLKSLDMKMSELMLNDLTI